MCVCICTYRINAECTHLDSCKPSSHHNHPTSTQYIEYKLLIGDDDDVESLRVKLAYKIARCKIKTTTTAPIFDLYITKLDRILYIFFVYLNLKDNLHLPEYRIVDVCVCGRWVIDELGYKFSFRKI